MYHDHPEIDDDGPLTAEEEADMADDPEPICDNCADLGCQKCDPEWALMYHTAAALDRILLGVK